MSAVLGEAQYKHCLSYLDDIIVYSKDFESHLQHLDDVLMRIERAGLKLKCSKCQFLRKEVEFLGHIVSAKGIRPNKNKVSVITSLEPPRCAKDIRSFIGMAGYYRRFIKGFSDIAKP